MITSCLLCGNKILTEAAPYIVMPHASGYHVICFTCAGELTGEPDADYIITQTALSKIKGDN